MWDLVEKGRKTKIRFLGFYIFPSKSHAKFEYLCVSLEGTTYSANTPIAEDIDLWD